MRQDQTGVATGINTIMRSIGGSVGAQLAAAILAGHQILGGRFPAERSFTYRYALLLSAAALIPAFMLAREERRARSRPAAPPALEGPAAQVDGERSAAIAVG